MTPLRRIQLLATGLLVAMAALFVAARSWEATMPWAGYVRAFAEAAMVGGLADWFAVTALFRHPMGLPIPHTAIIPRNKDRIGDNLAQFLRHNFLTPLVVARRLDGFDLAAMAGRWLVRGPGEGRLRRGFAHLATQCLNALDNDTIGGMLRAAAVGRLRAFAVSPMLGRLVEAAVKAGRHEPLVDSAILWAARTLDDNESLIREMVRARTAWLLRLASLDEKLSDRIIDALRKLLDDMAADPAHPLRVQLGTALAGLGHDLQHDPDLQARIEAIKHDLIDNPAIARTLDGLWDQARTALLAMLANPDAAMSGRLGVALVQLGETINRDAALRGAINAYARRAIIGMVADYGDGIVSIVSDTVRGWDAGTISTRLEQAVGRDLQYIRINGTLIGGLVGLVIHATVQLL